MSPSSQHPARARLVAFADGKLSGTELSDVQQHVQQCDDCAATVEALFDECTLLKNVPEPGAKADYRSELRAGAVIADRYTLRNKISEGGMGQVWAAKQSQPVKRKVAVKLIKLGMDSKEVVARFEQER